MSSKPELQEVLVLPYSAFAATSLGDTPRVSASSRDMRYWVQSRINLVKIGLGEGPSC